MNNSTDWIDRHGLKVFAIVLLLGALTNIPYAAYFQIMNWVTALAAVQVAYRGYRDGKSWATWLFGAVAILFNPIAPIYLRNDIWQIADVVVAVLMLASIFLMKKKQVA